MFEYDDDPDVSWIDEADYEAGRTTFIAYTTAGDCECCCNAEVTDSLWGIHVLAEAADDVLGVTWSAGNVHELKDNYLWSLVMDALELPSLHRCRLCGTEEPDSGATGAPLCVHADTRPSIFMERVRPT